MQRLYGITLPVLLAAVVVDAIPTIPTVSPAAPVTNGIVAADDGSIYFADSFHNTIWRLQADGTVDAFITGRAARALQLDASGNIYGTHHAQRGRVQLWRADATGVLIDLPHVSLGDEHNHAFVIGDGGAVIGWSSGGRRSGARLWRAEQHRRRLIAGGDAGSRDGQGAEARFLTIGAMTRTSSGELIVTSGSTVRRVDLNGNVTTLAAGDALLRPRPSLLNRLFGQQESHLSGVAISPAGDIFVANSARDAVVRVGRDGTVRDVFVSESGWTPTGVAVSPAGVVYVLEYGPGVRVRRLDRYGSLVIAQVRANAASARASG